MNDFINKMGEYWSQLSFDKLGDILTYHHNAPILFSSGLFFFLFIGFLIIYMSLRKHLLTRIIYVTLFSIYFYYKSSGFSFSCCLSQHPIFALRSVWPRRLPDGSAKHGLS